MNPYFKMRDQPRLPTDFSSFSQTTPNKEILCLVTSISYIFYYMIHKLSVIKSNTVISVIYYFMTRFRYISVTQNIGFPSIRIDGVVGSNW